MPVKTTLESRLSCWGETFHCCRTSGPTKESSMSSMESASQPVPAYTRTSAWNLPNPMAVSASSVVYVSMAATCRFISKLKWSKADACHQRWDTYQLAAGFVRIEFRLITNRSSRMKRERRKAENRSRRWSTYEDGERRGSGVELAAGVCASSLVLCGWTDGDRLDQAGNGRWTGSNSRWTDGEERRGKWREHWARADPDVLVSLSGSAPYIYTPLVRFFLIQIKGINPVRFLRIEP